jgi:hypothetical protein
VTRSKDNIVFRVLKNQIKGHENIIKDQIIELKGFNQGLQLCRVEARVEVDGEWRVMVFITNKLSWSPRSVCDLYRRRWDIEVFFKQVKQSLKIGSFLGHSANAVRWQVYTALLIYVMLRYIAHLSKWGHSFTRLFAVVRSALWKKNNLIELLKSHGTASGRFKVIGSLNTAWLPGFSPTQKTRNRHHPNRTIKPCKFKACTAPRLCCGMAVFSFHESRICQNRSHHAARAGKGQQHE